LDIPRKLPRESAMKQVLGVPVAKGSDHFVVIPALRSYRNTYIRVAYIIGRPCRRVNGGAVSGGPGPGSWNGSAL
jgi:hypothetical protein